MPKVASQAASHTICQAVSHMDLLIKGRREKRERGRGEGGKEGFQTISRVTQIFPFPFFFSPPSVSSIEKKKKKKKVQILLRMERQLMLA